MAFGRNAKNSQARQPRRQVAPQAPRQEFFSYHANRRPASQPQAKNTGQRRPLLDAKAQERMARHLSKERLPVVLALLVLGASLLYMTTLSSVPKIVIDGGADFKVLRKVEVYQDAATEILQSSVGNKSKLTLNNTAVSQAMQRQFPELSHIEVVLPLTGHRPVIQAISERPALLLATQQGVFVIGESGKALMKVSDATNIPDKLPTVRDDANLTVKPGKGVLSGQDVIFITTLTQQFEAKNIDISSMTLPALAAELHVRIADKPYYIKFSLLSDPRIAAGQYFALQKKLEADKVSPAEYVDSRVEERIYYK